MEAGGSGRAVAAIAPAFRLAIRCSPTPCASPPWPTERRTSTGNRIGVPHWWRRVTSKRQCFLTGVWGVGASWMHSTDHVRVTNDGTNWWIDGAVETSQLGNSRGYASAMCVDMPTGTWVGTGVWGAGDSSLIDRECGLGFHRDGLRTHRSTRRFMANDWTDGALINWPSSIPGWWTLSLKNGKKAWVTCMQSRRGTLPDANEFANVGQKGASPAPFTTLRTSDKKAIDAHVSTSLKYTSAKSTKARVENSTAVRVTNGADANIATLDESVANRRKVNAVVGGHVGFLDPHALTVLNHGKATDGRAAGRHQGFRIVQGRAAIETYAQEQSVGVKIVKFFERSSAPLAELQCVLRRDVRCVTTIGAHGHQRMVAPSRPRINAKSLRDGSHGRRRRPRIRILAGLLEASICSVTPPASPGCRSARALSAAHGSR